MLEWVASEKNAVSFVRRFLLGEQPGQWQNLAAALAIRGLQGPTTKTTPPTERELPLGGPVRIVLVDEPSTGKAIVRLELADLDVGPVTVRLFRGALETDLSPEVLEAFSLTREASARELSIDADALPAVHLEVEQRDEILE